MKVKSGSEVAQSCPTPSDPMDCSLPGSSIHGISRQEYWRGLGCGYTFGGGVNIQLIILAIARFPLEIEDEWSTLGGRNVEAS